METKYIKGVGEKRAKLLAKDLGINDVRELLYYFPYRYVDRSKFYRIADFDGEMPMVQVRGRFVRFAEEGEGAKRRRVGLFNDGRSIMEVVWFSGLKYIAESVVCGVEYVLFGKPSFYRGAYSMVHPEIERADAGRAPTGFRGTYTLSENARHSNFTQKSLSGIVANALETKYFQEFPETLPSEVTTALHLMPVRDAIRNMHFPQNTRDLQAARERFKFEELFYIELNILRYARRRSASIRGHVFGRIGHYFNTFYNNVLPFPLTEAQKRVLREIRGDMRHGRQMNRLLQGDVGCGKTLVAFMAMLMALDNGYQAAIMAPTEILAQQHYETLSAWCAPLGIKCARLTGSTRTKPRRDIDAALRDGSLQILVGTHALLEEKVVFANLGIAIIDEQHRFGVAQRAKMWNKGETPPHVLVMTATPIPRTLAMTVYGDLEVSVIDELPPGRKPVETWLRYDENRGEVDRLIASQLRQGRQIYMVYPLVHQNDKLNLKSLEKDLEYVREKYPHYTVVCVHGQLKAAEKDYQMQQFVSGEAQIMVATTVIEVGVNVPNASVMVIENAERFGLSQLHQLRGRVGRGADRSFCVLMSKYKIAAETRKRLTVMTQTTDGFLVSEADMQMRGPGDMEGTMQSGLPFKLQVANLARDGQILTRARQEAEAILAANPQLVAAEPAADATPDSQPDPAYRLSEEGLATLRREMRLRFDGQTDWSLIS